MRKILLPILIVALLCVIFFVIDLVDGTTSTYWYHSYDPTIHYPGYPPEWLPSRESPVVVHTPIYWAPVASIISAGLIFYIVAIQAVIGNARRYGRNAIRWATAFAIFTPILAGIVYLLTWPKSQKPPPIGQVK